MVRGLCTVCGSNICPSKLAQHANKKGILATQKSKQTVRANKCMCVCQSCPELWSAHFRNQQSFVSSVCEEQPMFQE